MAVSRRYVFRLGQALLATAAMPAKIFGAGWESDSGGREVPRLSSLSRESFQPLVGSGFAVRSGPETHTWLTLLSVEDMTYQPPAYQPPMAVPPKRPVAPAVKLDTFALHFQGAGDSLSQDTYVLEHESLGRLDLLLVPSGISQYAAIFNRLRSR